MIIDFEQIKSVYTPNGLSLIGVANDNTVINIQHLPQCEFVTVAVICLVTFLPGVSLGLQVLSLYACVCTCVCVFVCVAITILSVRQLITRAS